MRTDPAPLLTAGGLAARIGRSIDWVRVHADAGHLPYRRDNAGRRLFEPEAVALALTLIGDKP